MTGTVLISASITSLRPWQTEPTLMLTPNRPDFKIRGENSLQRQQYPQGYFHQKTARLFGRFFEKCGKKTILVS